MDVRETADRAAKGENLSLEEVTGLFESNEEERKILYEKAREIRDRVYGDKIFTYGFVYYSTYCRNNCSFCYFRRISGLERYRKTTEEITELSGNLQDAGINLVDLTMGEDPYFLNDECARLLELIRSVRSSVDIGIMVSPGAVPRSVFPKIREAGADWYACYQETYNKKLFSELRLEQDYQNRIDVRKWAKEAGLLTEDGMMVGLGESASDRADFVLRQGPQDCDQIRAMTFVPQGGTPMENMTPMDSKDELLAIAIMRIMYPDRLIPATLDVEGISGMIDRLNAGANLITSIVPPNKNLAGVAQHELDIENGHRSVEYVFGMLDKIGKRPASFPEFKAFMDGRRNRNGGR
ncbi:MAG: methylornithine synthase PylB [Candidatus Methanomethylophilaceae archaeon]|jgi:methylornithine synthase